MGGSSDVSFLYINGVTMTRETLLQSILTEIQELRDITNDTSIRGMTEDMRDALADPLSKLQILNTTLLESTDTTVTTEGLDVFSFHQLTGFIKVTGSSTVTFQGSPNNTDWYELGVVDHLGTTRVAPLTYTVPTNDVVEVVNASVIRYIRAVVTISTGTVSIDLMGRSR
jgi:hypothetical protein